MGEREGETRFFTEGRISESLSAFGFLKKENCGFYFQFFVVYNKRLGLGKQENGHAGESDRLGVHVPVF